MKRWRWLIGLLLGSLVIGLVGVTAPTPVVAKDLPHHKLYKAINATVGQLDDTSSSVMVQSLGGKYFEGPVKPGGGAVDAGGFIRLFVMAAVYHQVKKGKLGWRQTYTVDADNAVAGSGVLQNMDTGTTVMLKQLVKYMMTKDDDWATDILIQAMGGKKKTTKILDKLKFANTEVTTYIGDTDDTELGADNQTDASDVADALSRMYRGKLVSKKASKAMWKLLEKGTGPSALAAKLPSSATYDNIAHVNDDLGAVEEAAIIFNKHGKGVIVVAMSEGGDTDVEQGAFHSLGKKVYHAVLK